MWHYCEYVPGILVEGGQLYYCWHCDAEQFVPDPSVLTSEPETKPSEDDGLGIPLGEIPF